jgi:integrase
MAVKRTKRGYQIQWYDADGRFRKRTTHGITREEAIKLQRDILAKRDRGEPLFDPRRGPTFATFASTWIAEHRAGWRASTQAQYADVIRCWLQPAFGAARLADLTESRVRQLVARLQDAQLSPRRINYVVSVLRMIVKVALRRRLLAVNPLVDIRPLRVPKTEVDPLNPDEVDAFLRACLPFWRPYFTVAFWTGARPSELFALKKGDVDWDSETFRIRPRGASATCPCCHRYARRSVLS